MDDTIGSTGNNSGKSRKGKRKNFAVASVMQSLMFPATALAASRLKCFAREKASLVDLMSVLSDPIPEV